MYSATAHGVRPGKYARPALTCTGAGQAADHAAVGDLSSMVALAGVHERELNSAAKGAVCS